MKKHFMELFMACLMLVSFYFLSREAVDVSKELTSGKVIVVDAGHGGIDPGMIGVGNLEEKGINLVIAQKLRAVLEERGYTVVMTREEDRGLYEENSRNKKAEDMQNRIALIQEKQPLLTVSIHQNSYQESYVRGPQVFYYEDSPEGQRLAEILQDKLNTGLDVVRPREAKGNKTYYLLKRSPGILNIVECGFLTNPEEAALLQNEEYQQKVALAVADGICEYLRE